jgi:drug/metabolite transporter (DMT)-like permease
MLVPTMALMLAVGPSNYILYKIAFTSYGASSALFAMQMVNLLFVVYGAVALYAVRGAITDEMRASSKVPYALMALLDCLGGLCAALGAARTPGQLQTLLSQSLVPCTMVASAVFLKTRYGAKKKLGAAIILVGGAIVVAPAFRESAETSAVLIYWSSNIPMALSAVYKEWRFADSEVHVIYLTQWVSSFQLLFGFLLFPAQCLTAGVPLETATRTFLDDAVLVATGADAYRTSLLALYVLNNFILNTSGIVVLKLGGADTASFFNPCRRRRAGGIGVLSATCHLAPSTSSAQAPRSRQFSTPCSCRSRRWPLGLRFSDSTKNRSWRQL